MGYAQALLSKDVSSERAKLERQSAKKGLFGSLGRTLGGVVAMGLTGGMASPFLVGLTTAGLSAAGGAIGANQAKIQGGKFLQSERADLKSRLGGLGSENIVGSLTSGITAGTTQALAQTKAMKEAKNLYQTKTLAEGGKTSAEGFKAAAESVRFKGLDFGGSYLGPSGQAGLQAGKQLIGGGAGIAATGFGIGRDYLSQGLGMYGKTGAPGSPVASWLSERIER